MRWCWLILCTDVDGLLMSIHLLQQQVLDEHTCSIKRAPGSHVLNLMLRKGSVGLVLLHRDVFLSSIPMVTLLITLLCWPDPCCHPNLLALDSCSLRQNAVGETHQLFAPSATLPMLVILEVSQVSSHQSIETVGLLPGVDATC